MSPLIDNSPTHSVLVPIQVSEQFLADIVGTALESPMTASWVSHIRLRTPKWEHETRVTYREHPQDWDYRNEMELLERGNVGLMPLDSVVVERANDEAWTAYLARNVAAGGTLTFYEQHDDGTGYTAHRLTRDALLQAVAKALQGAVHHDLFNLRDHDAIGADAVIQLALFGEVVYG